MPAATDRGLLSATNRGNVLNPDHEPLAHGSECRLELIQAGAMSHGEQSIDLREMPVQPSGQLGLPDLRIAHRLVQADLRFGQRRYRQAVFRGRGRRQWNIPAVLDVRVDCCGKRVCGMLQRVLDVLAVRVRFRKIRKADSG